MIWVWIRQLFFAVVRLLVPPPDYRLIRKIEPNAQCPVCHGTQGHIEFSRIYTAGEPKGMPMVVHQCSVCKCAWGEPPISIPKYPVDLTSNGGN